MQSIVRAQITTTLYGVFYFELQFYPKSFSVSDKIHCKTVANSDKTLAKWMRKSVCIIIILLQKKSIYIRPLSH